MPTKVFLRAPATPARQGSGVGRECRRGARRGQRRLLFGMHSLFQFSIGRTDFPGASHEQLIRSIKEKLLPLGDDCEVYSGHGAPTLIGREKKYNPFLQDDAPRGGGSSLIIP